MYENEIKVHKNTKNKRGLMSDNAIDLNDYWQIDDEVICLLRGEGKILDIDDKIITVKFGEGKIAHYFSDGQRCSAYRGENKTLYHKGTKIEISEFVPTRCPRVSSK